MTIAAELFGVTQPAMSRLITQLEEEVGCRILSRERGQLALTAEGAQFYVAAKDVLASMRSLMAVADRLNAAPEVTIRLVSMPGIVNGLFDRAIAAFSNKNSSVRITVEVQNRGLLEKTVEAGQFDLAFATLPIKVPPFITIARLKTVPAVCIVAKRDDLAKKRHVSAEDLRDRPFISFRRGSLLRERVDELFEKMRIKRATLYESHSIEIVCEMVAAGMGVAIVPPYLPLSSRYPVAERKFVPEISVEYAMLQPSTERVGRHAERLAEMIRARA